MLLIVAVSCLLHCIVHITAHERRYKNLYGFEDFNITSDPSLVLGGISFLLRSDQFAKEAQPDTTPRENSRYDFIIVGAGTAGSTLASRLTESPDVEVLLIEAGDEEGLWMDIPLLPPLLQTDLNINWAYQSEPSDGYCLGMVNHQCNIPRGKMMGGTSSLNYMIATRGYRGDFDRWEELGNPGWSYKDVLPYFKKLEDMLIPELATDKKYHGTKGPVSITYPPFHTPLSDAFLNAAQELGFPLVDYNAEDFMGFSRIQSTTLNGLRMSANKAYLRNKVRRNLHVTKRSLVSKVLINPSTKRARGVEFQKNNRTYTVYARKEVILSAGFIGSPQILMLSGIGPKEHLKEMGIKVIKDLPVGLNLQDHVAYPGVAFTVDQPVGLLMAEIARSGTPYIRDYLVQQTGPLSVIGGGTECIGFMNAFDPLNPNATPNLEQLFFSASLGSDTTLLNVIGINSKIQKLLAPLQQEFSWSTLPVLLKPKSRGDIKLRSTDINDKPIIRLNILDHPDDIRTLIAGVNISLALGETEAMRKFNSKLFEFELDECDEYYGNFDQYMECYLRQLAITIYHNCGTCKMGPESDCTSVVNSQLKVIGVDGLRVVDASIMPEVPSAHINLPTFMIAEKAADMIKDYWGL